MNLFANRFNPCSGKLRSKYLWWHLLTQKLKIKSTLCLQSVLHLLLFPWARTTQGISTFSVSRATSRLVIHKNLPFQEIFRRIHSLFNYYLATLHIPDQSAKSVVENPYTDLQDFVRFVFSQIQRIILWELNDNGRGYVFLDTDGACVTAVGISIN